MDKAFVKGLRLIEALSASDRARGITDLARELDLTKSNVHRLLTTLQREGYVRQRADSAYELTTRIWEVGSRVIGRMDLPRIAQPAMAKLAAATGETVHLSILDDCEVVYIDRIESDHPVRAHTTIGSRAPAWTAATGKAMLALLPEAYLDRFEGRFYPYTPASLTSLDALRADIATTRALGYCPMVRAEWREGIAAVAAAITDASGALVGGIGISGPESRLKRRQIKAYASDVQTAAREIGTALGTSPPMR